MKATLKRKLVSLALGGSLLQIGLGGWWGGGLASCVSNSARTDFYTNVGHAVIDTAENSAATVGTDANAIVIAPAAEFFRDLWTTFVDLRIPTDPTFDRLLVD